MNKSEKVRELMRYVLFKPDEIVDGKPPEDAIIVEGIVNKFAFHKDRVAEKKGNIKFLLNEMQIPFHKNSGGGWSFLNLCEDKHGEHWAEHKTMGELVCLGLATGMVTYAASRKNWNMFPGGMPYITIDTEGD